MTPLALHEISRDSELRGTLHWNIRNEQLLQSMWEQYVHDELFHIDIFSLPMLEKVTHHTLHLTKYYSEIMNSALDENRLYITRLVDTVSTCLTLFGIFNHVPSLTHTYFETEVPSHNYDEDYSTMVHMLSKWTEQNKHGPSVSFTRSAIIAEIQKTYCNTLLLLINAKRNPFTSVAERRVEIQKRSIFYPMLHRVYTQRVNIRGSNKFSG